MNELKQGDKVRFDLTEKIVDINGIVCGKIGPVIIVELDGPLKGYEFTHIYILDTQIKS